MSRSLKIELGVKSDPIEYRYSFPWLFRLMADESIGHVQLGTFFELYHLPDAYFRDLRLCAQDHGVAISSVFTAHRELGGFFTGNPHCEQVARRNYERLIEVAALVGAKHAGSNPGAILRDRMEHKPAGIVCYLGHMRELMRFARDKGLDCLTIEPMSCIAEPPTLPDEVEAMTRELALYHEAREDLVPVGYCADTSHGYADADGVVWVTHLASLEATFPHLVELHLKNTDSIFNSTFGFCRSERNRGIVDLAQVRELLMKNAGTIPVDTLVAYLEIGGPKLGRDYSDRYLEEVLRESLQHIKEVFGKTVR
ncbi:MAG: hypothetical protein QG656_1876 [Candidatus Hydrogenedentes bacterium]|nr:hypothetical protein [Candidatus Hydrogenedentota bacterium]